MLTSLSGKLSVLHDQQITWHGNSFNICCRGVSKFAGFRGAFCFAGRLNFPGGFGF